MKNFKFESVRDFIQEVRMIFENFRKFHAVDFESNPEADVCVACFRAEEIFSVYVATKRNH